jgi:hypothetical protein
VWLGRTYNLETVIATSPSYSRAFSRARNTSAEYHWREQVKPYLLAQVGRYPGEASELPAVLEVRGRQLARAIVRANQMDKRRVEIERYVKRHNKKLAKESLVLAMSRQEFERWSYCQEASRRADDTCDRIIKSLSDEVHRVREGDHGFDLVAAMSESEADAIIGAATTTRTGASAENAADGVSVQARATADENDSQD